MNDAVDDTVNNALGNNAGAIAGSMRDIDMQAQFANYKARIDDVLEQLLPAADRPVAGNLQAAMRYAVVNGGKRVRPSLTYATGKALGIPLAQLDIPAAAVELVHAYSLVHDDLPAMDDDDLRRGLPTCHRQFDEATAILAGDALQAFAFTLLAAAESPALDDATRVRMIVLLGDASGVEGMAAGQAMDLAAVGKKLSIEQLEHMHLRKTGALLRSSVLMATTLSPQPSENLRTALDGYARAIGLAFQIVDDILDEVADTATLGKQQGADRALNKPTYPALLGLDGARQHARNMHERALNCLEGQGPEFDELRQISAFIVQRSY